MSYGREEEPGACLTRSISSSSSSLSCPSSASPASPSSPSPSSSSSVSSASPSSFSFYTYASTVIFVLLGTALGPHFEGLRQHLDSIFVAFGHPWNHFGRHWAPLGQPCGPKGENKEFTVPTWPTQVPIWCPFGSHFFHKNRIFSSKNGFPQQPHNQVQFLFDFFAISMTPGP